MSNAPHLAQLADIYRTEGPQTIIRKNLTRPKLIICNIAYREIGSFLTEARQKINQEVDLPARHYVTFGGQTLLFYIHISGG